MTARNDITGDALRTKGSTDAYRSGWDRIFGKKEEPKEEPVFHLRSYGDVSAADIEALAKAKKEAEELARQEADALRQEWWKYCADNQSTLSVELSSGNLVPTFEEWRKLVGR